MQGCSGGFATDARQAQMHRLISPIKIIRPAARHARADAHEAATRWRRRRCHVGLRFARVLLPSAPIPCAAIGRALPRYLLIVMAILLLLKPDIEIAAKIDHAPDMPLQARIARAPAATHATFTAMARPIFVENEGLLS